MTATKMNNCQTCHWWLQIVADDAPHATCVFLTGVNAYDKEHNFLKPLIARGGVLTLPTFGCTSHKAKEPPHA